MGNGDKNYSAERGCRERKEKAAAEDAKLRKDPPADYGTDQAEDDVRNAAEATSTREFSGEPTGDEAEEQPSDDATRPPLDDDSSLLQKNEEREHAISRDNFAAFSKCSKNEERFLAPLGMTALLRAEWIAARCTSGTYIYGDAGSC
jgi:hypothetical protein